MDGRVDEIRSLAVLLLVAVFPPATVVAQEAAPGPEETTAVMAPVAEPEEEKNPLELSADLRLRSELDHRSDPTIADDAEFRFRPRLRARAGLVYSEPVEGLSFALRLASNVGAPGNSSHQDLSANLGGPGHVVSLNRAFVRYELWKLWIRGGKQGWPHWQQTEVSWDEDIQPEGLDGGFGFDPYEGGTVAVGAGFYWIANNGWRPGWFQNDTLGTWQLRYSADFGIVEGTVAFTGLHVRDESGSNIDDPDDPDDPDDSVGIAFGNTNFYAAAIQLKLDLPVTVLAGFDVYKSDARPAAMSQDRTTGFVAQARVGYDRFGARYYFYDVQETAAPFFGPATFTQDNFPNSRGGGLTGFTGHRIQLDLKIVDDVTVDLRAYLAEGHAENTLAFSELPGRSLQRYQINFDAKF